MNLCPECFDESVLKRRIVEIRPSYPDDEKCFFHPSKKGVPITEIAKMVDTVFRLNYRLSDESPWDQENGAASLEETIYDIVQCDDLRVTNGLMEALRKFDWYSPGDGEEPFYQEDRNYVFEGVGEGRYSDLWERFKFSVSHRQRFFNSDALKMLREIFDDVPSLKNRDGGWVVYELSGTDQIYRARRGPTFDKASRIRGAAEKELNAPPRRDRSSGRMNPSGIPVFYGALDPLTALSELRPQVGDYVTVGKFEPGRKLNVIDLTRFQRPLLAMSKFDKRYVRQSQIWKFMQTLMRDIARPVSVHDEHLDYVPTQIVAEFLFEHFLLTGRFENQKIDGILFASPQTGSGKNIAIRIADGDDEGSYDEDDFFRMPGEPAEEAREEKFVPRTSMSFVEGTAEIFQVEAATYRTCPLLTSPYDEDEYAS